MTILNDRELRAYIISHANPDEAARLQAYMTGGALHDFEAMISRLHDGIMAQVSPELREAIELHGNGVCAADSREALHAFFVDSWVMNDVRLSEQLGRPLLEDH